MKKNLLSYILFCLLIFVSGCSSDIALEPENKEETGSTILRLEINKETVTRGMITSTNFQEGDELLVRLKDYTYDSMYGNTILNCKATYINGVWELDTLIDVSKPYTYKSEKREWPDYIYINVGYPYDEISLPTKGTAFACNNVLSQTDILFGGVKVEKKDPVAKITCGHYLTCLSFDVKNETDKPIVVDSLTVTQRPMNYITAYRTTTFTFLPQSVETGAPRLEDYDINYYDNFREKYTCQYNINILPGEKKKIDFMLNPTDWLYEYIYEPSKHEMTLEPLKFELSVNGQPVRFDIQPASWNSGQNYVYLVTIPPTFLNEIEPTKVHMYDTYDGKHVYWSNINIGATSETDYGRLFGWGDPSGKLTSENLDDYPSANPPEDIAGTEYDIATVNWGGKWRMPSDSDVWDLRRSANYEAEWTEINGVYGVRVTSNSTGNSIFFPTAPQRIGTQVKNNGFNTNYWLSKLNPEDHNKAYTIFFNYYSDSENPLSFYSSVGWERYYGLPVRAIWIDD